MCHYNVELLQQPSSVQCKTVLLGYLKQIIKILDIRALFFGSQHLIPIVSINVILDPIEIGVPTK